MDLINKLNAVGDRPSLAIFLELLAKDLKQNPTKWNNSDLESFLKAFSRWLVDCEGFYANNNRSVPVQPSWKDVGEMLMAARVYE